MKGVPIEDYPPANLNNEQTANLKALEKDFASKLGQDIILVAYKDLK